jgi:hypothetical protein
MGRTRGGGWNSTGLEADSFKGCFTRLRGSYSRVIPIDVVTGLGAEIVNVFGVWLLWAGLDIGGSACGLAAGQETAEQR